MRTQYPNPLILLLSLLLTACTASQQPKPAPDKGAQIEASMTNETRTITDFSSNQLGWSIQDDRVMGGVSRGNAEITEEGYLRFWGNVSLDNNGGFSSVQSGYDNTYELDGMKQFVLRVKGDGKKYTFRVKRARSERHSYAYTFPTTGEWETITIPFGEMTPTFRGYTPNVPNYGGEPVHQLRFLIGNKKEQIFELLVDEVRVAG